MSITVARLLNGEQVYAKDGETLRKKEIVCKHCNAKMHIHRYPESDDYYFALNPGEQHKSVCRYFDKEKDAPVFTGEKSPDDFIASLSPKKRSGGVGRREIGTVDHESGVIIKKGPKNVTSLLHIIKTGMYDEKAYDHTYWNSQYRFIDYVVFGKWARFIWKEQLVMLGARVVDCRWVGSFNMSEDDRNKLIGHMKKTREIWFTTFWKQNGDYVSVRYCLDCTECFSEIKRKLFKSELTEKKTYTDFIPKTDKVDVLIGTIWGTMDKEQCKEKCPRKMCKGCLGAYWGKCDGPKRIELFPFDDSTKKKEKTGE